MTFEDFSKALVIAQTTFNRRAITEISLANIEATKGLATHWVYDDHSTQMTVEEIQAMAPTATVVRLPGKKGIHSMRAFLHEEAIKAGFRFIYHTDNDAYHDPEWLKRMYDIWAKLQLPVGLYNTRHHLHNTLRTVDDVDVRHQCPGVSMMYELSKCPVPMVNPSFQWDINYSKALKEIAISKTAYVEHFGADGIHNKDHERDRAHTPTAWLQAERPRILELLGVPIK